MPRTRLTSLYMTGGSTVCFDSSSDDSFSQVTVQEDFIPLKIHYSLHITPPENEITILWSGEENPISTNSLRRSLLRKGAPDAST
jgi:hypothetical protein